MIRPTDSTAEVFKALGDETRLKILKLLSSSDRHYCVGAMAGKLSISQPAVSQHLKIMKQAGLINFTKTGNHKHYYLIESALDAWGIKLEGILEAVPMPEQTDYCCLKE